MANNKTLYQETFEEVFRMKSIPEYEITVILIKCAVKNNLLTKEEGEDLLWMAEDIKDRFLL